MQVIFVCDLHSSSPRRTTTDSCQWNGGDGDEAAAAAAYTAFQQKCKSKIQSKYKYFYIAKIMASMLHGVNCRQA